MGCDCLSLEFMAWEGRESSGRFWEWKSQLDGRQCTIWERKLYDTEGTGSGKNNWMSFQARCCIMCTRLDNEGSRSTIITSGLFWRKATTFDSLDRFTIHHHLLHPITQLPPEIQPLLLHSPRISKREQPIQRQQTQSSRKWFLTSQRPRNGGAGKDD